MADTISLLEKRADVHFKYYFQHRVIRSETIKPPFDMQSRRSRPPETLDGVIFALSDLGDDLNVLEDD